MARAGEEGRARLLPGRARLGTDGLASGLVTHMRTRLFVLLFSLPSFFPWNSSLEKRSPRLGKSFLEKEGPTFETDKMFRDTTLHFSDLLACRPLEATARASAQVLLTETNVASGDVSK